MPDQVGPLVGRLVPKAIRSLTGDQSGSYSFSGVAVRRDGVPPSAGTTYRSLWPLRVLAKTILSPSGDQLGSESVNLSRVRRTSPAPLTPTTNRSPSRMKARRT